ncbi:MAG: hypothetical protein J2P25_24830 [Nocardiopsaceae bacterium]|nr:hypothetical protein [Nocardiopsaceae bacterium]
MTVFTPETRDRLRSALLERAADDPDVTGAAFTGSHGTGDGDRWSDTDLVLAVRGSLQPVVTRWTDWCYGELGARHHWDLPRPPRAIRVFLLPEWLEIDLTFTPEDAFGPRGPQWRTVFGEARRQEPFREPDARYVTGLIWHHALHARMCVERGHWWQAEHWIGALRTEVITLACLRLGYPTAYDKGAHLLPPGLAGPLEATLVRSLAGPELRRALRAAAEAAADEIERSDPALASTLRPMLAELTGARSLTIRLMQQVSKMILVLHIEIHATSA